MQPDGATANRNWADLCHSYWAISVLRTKQACVEAPIVSALCERGVAKISELIQIVSNNA